MCPLFREFRDLSNVAKVSAVANIRMSTTVYYMACYVLTRLFVPEGRIDYKKIYKTKRKK